MTWRETATEVSISSADYLSDTNTHPGIGAIDVLRLMRPATAGSLDRNRGVVKLPDSQNSRSAARTRGGPASVRTAALFTSPPTIRPSVNPGLLPPAARVPLQRVVEPARQTGRRWMDGRTEGQTGSSGCRGDRPWLWCWEGGGGQKGGKDRKERIAPQSMRPFLF